MPSEYLPQPSKRANRLAFRVRILYLVIPLFMVVTILGMGRLISRNIADESSRRLARQYAIEAVSNFQISTSPHFMLMQQMSRSVTISRWLANENDPVSKAMAFEEIMGYAVFVPQVYIMFTVYETLRGYNFDIGLTLEEFNYWGRLSGGAASQWFFDTRDAEAHFSLNIQRTRPDLYGQWWLYIWSNNRMYYHGRFVGVVTVGSPFDGIFHSTFGGFDVNNKRGYIIDRNGRVRSDSSMRLEILEEGLAIHPVLPEAAYNPALAIGINKHLQRMVGGIFQIEEDTLEAIPLTKGIYRYASIAPITGTDWSVVVLSNHLGVFGGARYNPLIFVTVAALVFSVIIGNILIRRIALTPLFKLTQSVAISANMTIKTDLFGLSRDDEIGDLARTIQYMQTMQENSRAKSRFLARMSHEIRTPITAVLGISEIQLNNTALPLETEEAFSKIYNSANTLLGIVNDILDMSKVEAGKMEICNTAYESANMLSDIIHLNLAYLGSKKLSFDIDVDENIPAFLIGDELRIKQVLNNLLSNAFKYTDTGAVSLKAYAKSASQSDYVNIVVVVQDTGRGMSKAQLKALFDEYSRFHEKEHRFEAGTGLGMPITYALLQMMNGTIDVVSETGKGTTVTIVLPQKIASHELLGAERVKGFSDFSNFNTDAHFAARRLSFIPEPMPYGRVLVVDDVEANIYVAAGLMGLYQLQIDTCSSGPAAIEKIKSGEVYDIIFMDQMMPEMNGTEAVAIIRRMNYKRTIVALTADALVGQAEKFLQNGFDGFLSKPIQTVQLNAILHKFVKDSHPEAATAINKTSPTLENDMLRNKTLNGSNKSIDDYFGNFMEASGINDKIRRDIVRNRKNIMSEVNDAILKNDISTAHRLVHTLKGLVGSIGEKTLFNLSEKVEISLRIGVVPANLIDDLALEMERVLASFRQLLNEPEEQPSAGTSLSKERTKEIFDKLAQLLKENSFEALGLCGELALIPQAKDLITQIEAVDFALALKTLEELRITLKVETTS